MDETTPVTVGAFMTGPRYESVWVRGIINSALNNLKIPLTVSQGVFYGQCMQRMLEDALTKPIDFAITVDSDSVFTSSDVMRLINVMANEPTIDALASLQSRRGKLKPLFSIQPPENYRQGDDIYIPADQPFAATAAHFGLTIIRLERLRDVPKPWFYAKPNEAGMWEADHIDDDIWFWKQWREAGRNVFIDPLVRIGHLEEMVSVYDEQMEASHIHPSEWLRRNSPNLLVVDEVKT